MQPLTEKHRKWAAIILASFGIVVVFFGFRRLNNMASSPFSVSSLPLEEEASEEERVKQNLVKKDTDADTINDYDELFVFNTSPYLSDSDSDGVNDKDEITQGKDPNCPSGQDCSGQIIEVKKEVSESGGFPQFSETTVPDKEKETLRKNLPENPRADDVREILKQSGQFSDEELNKLSDEEILSIYKDALSNF